jgi:YbbR domain-containing protein
MNKWLEKEMVLRLISVGLAVMLWFSVTQPSLSSSAEHSFSTRIRNVSVEALYDQDRFELTGSIEKVELTLYGDKTMLERLPFTYRIFVDARRLGAGTHRLPVQVEGLPAGVEKRVEPSTVEVTLEEKLSKEMPVKVDVVGDLPDGFKAGDPIVPRKVLVRGAESKLEQVKSVRAAVYLGESTETIRKQVRLQAYGDKGPLNQVEVIPETVLVEVPIHIPYKEVPLTVEISRNPPPGYAVESLLVRPDLVTVFGPQKYIDDLQLYLGPRIDLSGVTRDRTFMVPVPIHEDAIKVEPKQVEIYVKMVPAETKTVENIPLRITGLSAGRKATILSPSGGRLNIKLSGAPKLLEQIGSADMDAIIDVSGLAPGIHEVPIRITLPFLIEQAENKTWRARVEID